MRIILTFAILSFAGCAVHQPVAANWRLTKQGAGDIPIPPGVADPNLSRRTLAVDLVTVTREMLLQQQQGWLTAWAEGIESQGCIAHGQGSILAGRIAESLPLDPGLAFHLVYPSDRQSGQVDIAPPVRLQVVSPILRDGAGFTITPLYAERHVNGETDRRAQPAANYLQFPPDAAFYRLFYKSGQTDFTALVVAAPTRAELERRIGLPDAASASCDPLHGELCVVIPRRVAINPMVPVTVNGVDVMVAWGATVAEAIRNAGERQPEAVLPKLAVSRLYNGRPAPVDFDHTSPAVLRLIPTGGEEITWNRR